ncbi:MAG: STM4011 family radical SAM protein [Bacteroidota bacterium]
MMEVGPQKEWKILYRGVLSGCNYDCVYCPFAKNVDSREVLAQDKVDLMRFVDWVGKRKERMQILLTPWGEGLIRRHYQEALVRLSHMAHVDKCAIQTNLSGRLDWVEKADLAALGLWTTYHPSQVERSRFLAQCAELDRLGVRYSVGMVGLKEDLNEIEAMRRALPENVYMWVNAYKRERPYYSTEEIERLKAVDPHFELNNTYHASMGRACFGGESSFSVDGFGNFYRCHFIKTPLGNIYQPHFEQALKARDCTNATCGCHIGYVHLKELNLYETFGNGLMERIPAEWPVAAHS